jgi:hypothetical protein
MRRLLTLPGLGASLLTLCVVPISAQSVREIVIQDVHASEAQILSGAAAAVPVAAGAFGTIPARAMHLENGESIWLLQADAGLAGPLAAEGDTVTVFFQIYDRDGVRLSRGTALVDERLGVRAAPDADRCVVAFAEDAWAYVISPLGGALRDDRSQPRPLFAVRGEVAPGGSPAPPPAVLARIHQVFREKLEAAFREVVADAFYDRQMVRAMMFGDRDDGMVDQLPILAARTPDGVRYVVPMNLRDDPSEKAGETLLSLVFDQEGAVLQESPHFLWEPVVADLDRDGVDEILTAFGVFVYRDGRFQLPTEALVREYGGGCT